MEEMKEIKDTLMKKPVMTAEEKEEIYI